MLASSAHILYSKFVKMDWLLMIQLIQILTNFERKKTQIFDNLNK